jgi:signal transduction histidine kinase
VRAEHEIALSRLQIQTREAERANQAKSMFLAKISHEMRTPLYSIQGLAEHLLKTLRNADDTRSLRSILRASQTLYHTISDILDFTQLEGGKYQPALKSFDLWDEIETNTETIGLLAQEQGLYLDVIVGHEVPRTVVGDQKGFRTVVANLVSNAVKFTSQGGVCIRVDLESQPQTAGRSSDCRFRTRVRAFPPTGSLPSLSLLSRLMVG